MRTFIIPLTVVAAVAAGAASAATTVGTIGKINRATDVVTLTDGSTYQFEIDRHGFRSMNNFKVGDTVSIAWSQVGDARYVESISPRG